MRVLNFTEMSDLYNETMGGRGFEQNDINERNQLLIEKSFLVIVEGEFLELDNIDKWANTNIEESPIEEIFYGKTSYDFGCAEYFFRNLKNAEKFSNIVSKIYTTYPYALPNPLIQKTVGYDKSIEYNIDDKDAIVFY